MTDFVLLGSAGDFIKALAVLALTYALSFTMAHRLKIAQGWAFAYTTCHTAFSMVYVWWSMNNVADATFYFQQASLDTEGLKPGTSFILFATGFLTDVLGFNYLNCFLAYNMIGVAGLLLFAAALKRVTVDASRTIGAICILLPLLPGLNFWTGMLGKDTIAFGAVGLLCWTLAQPTLSKRNLLLAIILMALVRPHIAIIMATAFIISEFTVTKTSLPTKIGVILVSGLAIWFAYPLVASYVGLSSDSGNMSFSEYVEKRQGYNLDGGSSVDISNLPLPLQIFGYGFQPLFFDAHIAMALISSVENLILLVLILVLGTRLFRFRSAMALPHIILGVAYIAASWVILASTTANLGIAVRQKWMFMPVLLMLALALSTRALKSAGRTPFPMRGTAPLHPPFRQPLKQQGQPRSRHLN